MTLHGMKVHAVLTDRQGGSRAYLCLDGGGYRVVMDQDPNYSSIAKRCGTKLTRDYAVNAVRKGISRSNGIINGVTENADGSVTIRAAAVG